MKRAALQVLAAACLAALAGPVLADAYSTATFGNVTVTLVDLNPNDGIAPSISFLSNPTKFAGGSYVYGSTETGLPGGWEPGHELNQFEQTGAWQTTDVSGNAHVTYATASAAVKGAAGGVGFSALSASGHAQSGADNRGLYYAAASAPGAPASKFFVLSANTMVSFSVNAALSASMTLGYTPGALEGEGAAARLALYAGGLDATGASLPGDLEEHWASVLYESGAPMVGASDSWSGVMTASFSNLSNQSSKGEFYAEGLASGRSVVLAAVPEPATYGMLLGGLGLLGALARRRSSR